MKPITLSKAIDRDYLETVEKLLPDHNKVSTVLFEKVISRENFKMFELLLTKQRNDLSDVVMLAIKYRRIKMLEYLKSFKISLGKDILIRAVNTNDLKILIITLEIDNSWVYGIIHHAARIGNYYMVETLAKYGLNGQNDNGETALYIACKHGHYAVAWLLLYRSACPFTATREGWNPLHIAAHENYPNIVEMLCMFYSVDTATHNGRTALQISIDQKSIESTKVLLLKQLKPVCDKKMNNFSLIR